MTTVLETKRLTKSFGGIRALDCVSLTIAVGTVMGIIGPNGAGKTTLFNSITGFLQPTAGTICFKGADITAQPPYRIAAKGIGRTFQDLRLFGGLTVLEH